MKADHKCFLKPSDYYLHTPSLHAKKALYYPIAAGHYFCGKEYKVERAKYDSYLLLLIKFGCLSVDGNKGQHYEVAPATMLLLNCYEYHKYETKEYVEFYWVHIDGSMAAPFFNLLKERGQLIASLFSPGKAEYVFQRMLAMFREEAELQEIRFSKYITDLLTFMADSEDSAVIKNQNVFVSDAVTFINSHISGALSLKGLAARCNLSPYYFARRFKEETGYTPYEYVILARMNQAKYYLNSTDDSIKSIAYRCGYQNESNFCTAFKQRNKITPQAYRKFDMVKLPQI